MGKRTKFVMKIRRGHVSNSSSSSFVVAFDRMPSSEDELRQLMFGDDEYWFDYHDGRYPTREIARIIYDGLFHLSVKDEYGHIDEGRISYEDALNVMREGHTRNEPEYPYHLYGLYKSDRQKYDVLYQQYLSLCEKEKESLRNAMFSPTDLLFKFEFCDGDGGFWAMMEHSGIFERLRHIRVDKH